MKPKQGRKGTLHIILPINIRIKNENKIQTSAGKYVFIKIL